MAQDNGYVFEGNPENIDVEKEVEQKAKANSFDAYKLAKVLVNIGQKMTGVVLYDYQLEPTFRIIYSLLVRDGAEVTILYPRQSGKSEVVSIVTVTVAVLFPVLAKMFPKELSHFKNGAKMGLLAPQGEQVDTVYGRCVDRLMSDPVKDFMADPDINDQVISKSRFKTRSGSTLTGQSAAKQSKVESKTYHIVFLDESQDMDTDKVRRSIIPMTASTFGTIVRTGTPGRYKGDFYFTIQNNRKHDSKLRGSKDKETKKKHFQYDYLRVISDKEKQYKIDGLEFHLLYKKSVLRDRDSMGEKSEAFRMAYKVEWLLDVGMFITEADLETKVLENSAGFMSAEKAKGLHKIAGLDIASARAQTVLTHGYCLQPPIDFGDHATKVVRGWMALGGMNYEDQFQLLVSKLMEEEIQVLYADYTGVGRALTDMLIYYLGDIMEIVPYTFTPMSKSDMWKALDEDINNSKLIVPASKRVRSLQEFDDFYEQMTNLQKYWRGSYMVCEKTQGFMDDYCDSYGLFNLAGNHLYLPEQEMQEDNNIMFNLGNSHDLRNSSRY